jgi:hypothetical protein
VNVGSVIHVRPCLERIDTHIQVFVSLQLHFFRLMICPRKRLCVCCLFCIVSA